MSWNHVKAITIAAAFVMAGSLEAPLLQPATPAVFAAESLNIDSLPKDAKAYRVQVDQLLNKVDGVILKLQGTASAQAVVLDLEQTRDNILREIPKMKVAPGDAKWGTQEMRDSVQAMLKLMKEQYDKANSVAR